MRRRACDGSQDQGAAKGSHSVTDVSRGRCGENKPHHQKTAQCRGLNLDVIDCRCTVCAKAPLASLPDGIYDAGDQQRARSDRGNARRFEDGKLPKLLRIECYGPLPDWRQVPRVSSATIQPSKSFRSRICARPGGSGGRWFLPRRHH